MGKPSISLVIPVYNEAETISLLYAKIALLYDTFPKLEVIFVDDGSRDDGVARLRAIALKDRRVKLIAFSRNYGQTAALRAGIDHSSGEILVPMDSDMENDPADIPRLVEVIERGFDVVSGWRQNRWHGAYLTRKLPSTAANWLISKITGVRLHDYGCTLKAYRREMIVGVPLYGEMHRFIPAYAAQLGGKVTEIPVHYTPRRFGKSNYGLSRTFRVLLDLFVIRFLDRYMDRPIHFFGGLGFLLFFLGGLSGTVAIVLRLFFGLHLVQTPLPILTALFLIMGVNLIMMGILSEMLMRTYYEVNERKPYRIRETVNI